MLLVHNFPDMSLTLYDVKDKLVGPFIGIITTLLGFLASFVTLMFGIGGNKFARQYKRNGALGVFTGYYFLSLMTLVISIFACTINLSNASTYIAFRAMLYGLTTSITCVCFSSMIIINVMKKANIPDEEFKHTQIKGPKV